MPGTHSRCTKGRVHGTQGDTERLAEKPGAPPLGGHRHWTPPLESAANVPIASKVGGRRERPCLQGSVIEPVWRRRRRGYMLLKTASDVSTRLRASPSSLVRAISGGVADGYPHPSVGLQPLPANWTHGEPIRVGGRVVCTGCDEHERASLAARATALGVRVTAAVAQKTAALVTDGGFSGTRAAAAQSGGTRVIQPTLFALLIDHSQPASSAWRSARAGRGGGR